MTSYRKYMLGIGTAAMLATGAAPVSAARTFHPVAADNAGHVLNQSHEYHRKRWRHRDRVDAGDVLAGIGILAGIAIIAGAASEASKYDRNDRYEPRYDDRDFDQPQTDSSPAYGDDDLGSAVGLCTDAAERAAGDGERVREIRSVTRDGDGWRVEGELANEGFTCATANGRVDYIRLDQRDI